MRFDTLSGWLDWQAALNPKTIDLGLARVREVWQRLGAPPLHAPAISIAGTNGKGSCVAFAEAILQAAGYRTGCYTSPHLQRYNERIRIDQTALDDASICDAFARIDRVRGDIALTYFEFGTLAALLLFADAALDAVILEVGLGGRLDAVNLIDADVALISSIGLDHQEWLGDDRAAIGREKAGIARPGRPLVFAGRDMPDSIAAHAARIGAPLYLAGRDFSVQQHPDGWDFTARATRRHALPRPAMRGWVQIDNAAGVLMALDRLADRLPIDQRAVRSGLLAARLAGRFDVRPGVPTWILDVAHNPQAAAVLNDALGDFYVAGRRLALCGMLADKDAAGVAQALAGRFAAWHLIDLTDRTRGLSATQLADRLRPVLGDVPLQIDGSIDRALAGLARDAGPEDVVVVFGSFHTVGAALTWLDGPPAGAVAG